MLNKNVLNNSAEIILHKSVSRENYRNEETKALGIYGKKKYKKL